jgi:hypothetical protein
VYAVLKIRFCANAGQMKTQAVPGRVRTECTKWDWMMDGNMIVTNRQRSVRLRLALLCLRASFIEVQVINTIRDVSFAFFSCHCLNKTVFVKGCFMTEWIFQR